MRVRLSVILCLSMGSEALSAEAKAEAKVEAPEFRTPEGRKAFEDAKQAFVGKNLLEAKKRLARAKADAANRAAKDEIARWTLGLKGLQEYLLLEPKAKGQAGWVYENAQRKRLEYYTNPAGLLFKSLIEELEKPERKLVHKIQDFEHGGAFSLKFGKSFVTRSAEPENVVEGEKALKWEYKNRDCSVLKIEPVPQDWSQFDYLGFWLSQQKGKSSELQISLPNTKAARKGGDLQQSFSGYQMKIPQHVGWKYVTLSLGQGKGFRRVGTGDLTKVGYVHIQLSVGKPFVAYLDDFALVRKN